jgi:hypothetical protein
MLFYPETILLMERVASIATMPTRIKGFEKALNSMLPQVDRVFVYLDNFDTVPAFLKGHRKIEFFRMEELGNFHASSRFLALGRLARPSIVFLFDDDIIYPSNYVSKLVSVLAETRGRAIVGVHGRIFMPPHASYVEDAIFYHFADKLRQHLHVHELGAGTCAFISSLFDFDVAQWPDHGMDDILFSTEAQKRLIPRVAIRRPLGWLKAYAEDQPDSLWVKTKSDHMVQSKLMRLLLNACPHLEPSLSSCPYPLARAPFSTRFSIFIKELFFRNENIRKMGREISRAPPDDAYRCRVRGADG